MTLKVESKTEFGNLNVVGTWTDKKLYPYEMSLAFDGNTLFMRHGKYEIRYEPWSVKATRDKNEILPALKDNLYELNRIFLKCEAWYNSALAVLEKPNADTKAKKHILCFAENKKPCGCYEIKNVSVERFKKVFQNAKQEFEKEKLKHTDLNSAIASYLQDDGWQVRYIPFDDVVKL